MLLQIVSGFQVVKLFAIFGVARVCADTRRRGYIWGG